MALQLSAKVAAICTVAALFLGLALSNAHAQWATVGSACSPDGKLANSNGFLTCTGGVWVANPIIDASTYIQISAGTNTYLTLGKDVAAATNPQTFAGMWYENNVLRIEALSGGVSWRDIILQGRSGNVGIGTTTPPVAKLDVYGYMKLLAQTGAPITCSSTYKGSIAMTTNNGLCFCNGSAWNKVEAPTTACAW